MSNDLVGFVNQQKETFLSNAVDEKVNFAAESQFAVQALQANKFLYDTAYKNSESLRNAIINVAAIGISLNPANKHAYLVPREGKVCLDVSYMGLLHLAMSTGSIKWGQCKLVHDGDTYESNGLDHAPTHKYNPFSNRGNVIGGYCTVKTADGDYLTEEMSLDDIKQVQNASKAKNGPWQKYWNEMARKTIVKRASKYWPKVERLDQAIHNLNTDVGEGMQEQSEQPKDITPVTEVQLNTIVDYLADKGKTEADMCKYAPRLVGCNISSLEELTSEQAVKIISFLENYNA